MTPRDPIQQLQETTMRRVRGEAHALARAFGPVLHVCGINHTRASLDLLERYALDRPTARRIVERLHAETGAEQAFVLSTCNRTELYGWSGDPAFGGRLRAFMLAIGESSSPGDGPSPLYEYRGIEAVRHLFAVESGLDSMILGENYIKQQVSQAWESSQSAGASGPDLHRAIQAALRCGKRIRTETRLNEGTLETDVAAILKAERVLGTLEGKTCLVIGAGKIGRRAARTIAGKQPKRLLIVNRTVETAREIADACCGEAFGLDALPELLAETDFILAAAYAPEFVIRHHAYVEALRRRPLPAKICIVDTAVPRIIDPDLALLPMVELYDMEHMQELVELNRVRRTAAAQEAWKILEDETEKFRQELLHAELAPAIVRLREQFDRVFEEERAGMEPGLQEAKERRLKQRLLHESIVELKARFVEQE